MAEEHENQPACSDPPRWSRLLGGLALIALGTAGLAGFPFGRLTAETVQQNPLVVFAVFAGGCQLLAGILRLLGAAWTRPIAFMAVLPGTFFWIAPALCVFFVEMDVSTIVHVLAYGACATAVGWWQLGRIGREVPSDRRVGMEWLVWAGLLYGALTLAVLVSVPYWEVGGMCLWMGLLGMWAAGMIDAKRLRMPDSWQKETCRLLMYAVFGVSALLWGKYLALACSTPRFVTRRFACRNSLKNIERAIWSYADEFGHYPPAAELDSDGKPAVSWRRLIASRMDVDCSTLNDDEPWDSPDNLEAAKNIEPYQFCPSIGAAGPVDSGHTRVLAIVGDGLFFQPDGKTRKLGDYDHIRNTPAVIQVIDSDVLWTEPRDIAVEDILSGEFDWSRTNAHPHSNNCFLKESPYTHILFPDTTVRLFRGNPNREELKRLFSSQWEFTEDETYVTFDDPGIELDYRRIWLFWAWCASWSILAGGVGYARMRAEKMAAGAESSDAASS